MIRVILCDDHAMVRRGIKDTLSDTLDIEVVAEASNYAEVKDALRTHLCDVLILDLNLPGRGGMDVLASLKEAAAPTRVLVVSMFAEDQYAIRCLRAGAQGYLNKAGDPAELINAVRSAVTIPVIASSGAGCAEHFLEVFTRTKAEAALAAGIFHRKEVPIGEVKGYLQDKVEIRPV